MNKQLLQKKKYLLKKLLDESKKVYKKRLVTLAIFGSWAGEKNNPDSDLDILIIAKDLPRGRLARVKEFEKGEEALEAALQQLKKEGVHTYFSPVLKTPLEVRKGSLLFLDMLYQLNILYDKNNFFLNFLADFEKRLNKLGAKRITKGEKWYWVLKPDYKPGEIFEI